MNTALSSPYYSPRDRTGRRRMAAWAQSIWRWRLVPCGMLLCALLTGCASRGPAPEDAIVVTQPAAACRAYFALFDALVTRDHTAGHQAARIDEFPYLR